MTILQVGEDESKHVDTLTERPVPSVAPAHKRSQPRLNFRDEHRADHLAALYAWLPPALQEAPGLDWNSLPSPLIGYLVRTVGTSADGGTIAVAMSAMLGSVRPATIHSMASALHRLLCTLRDACGVTDLAQLAEREVWEQYVAKVPLSPRRTRQLTCYSTVADVHLRAYLERLAPAERTRMQSYALPLLPSRFLRTYADTKLAKQQSRRRRKEKSDVLVPLFPILVALLQFRKQAAERLRDAFRAAQHQVETEQATPPYPFSYEEVVPTVNRDARTLAEVQLQGRPVTMRCVLWDRRSWIRAHPQRFHFAARRFARSERTPSGTPGNHWFLQFLGPKEDLLWFGDLVDHTLVQHLSRRSARTPESRARWHLAQELGAPVGFMTDRPGLLAAPGKISRWLSEHQGPGELLLEPESLYRGVLYGAALALVALTNGSRASELLQVSYDRFKTRTYTVPVEQGGTRRLETRQLYLQLLLPKGAKTEEERQLFPMSHASVRLLKEIYEGLVAAHGTIPVVWPSRGSKKFDDLQPERYLFQWAASPDGRLGSLNVLSVTNLLRFVLHGLELYTQKGEPIHVSAHLLRHVTATAARQEFGVPLEALAWVLHHHQDGGAASPAGSVPEATSYYSQMTEEQRVISIADFHRDLEAQVRALELCMPEERDLETMNEDLQDVFACWQTLHPTAFGFCGCRYLCPRGYNRSLCIGCPYLVPDPDKIAFVQTWRGSYAKQAEQLEASGNPRDAQQARRQVQQLDDLITMMGIQQHAEENRQYQPAFRILPMLQRKASPMN